MAEQPGAAECKTWSLLVEPLRHMSNKDFGAVIFRRSYPEITNMGGMWDESQAIYGLTGASGVKGDLRWAFRGGARVNFAHLQYDDSVTAWRGAQIPMIGFDQLETFTQQQFFYMLSRNRSMCGVRPYVRATCNPEPGWLADFLGWWISDDGYADLSRVGKLRWLVRDGEMIRWFDTRDEAAEAYPLIEPKSVTFIVATVYDNQKLLAADPGYVANLQALNLIDRERLLGDPQRGGNWRIKPSAGKVFNRSWFSVVDAVPAGGRACRFWDFAATEKTLDKADPDYTASCLLLSVNGGYYILDVSEERLPPARIDATVKNIAAQDRNRLIEQGRTYAARWEQEPGSAGKRESWRMVQMLAGMDARGVSSSSDKLSRAKTLSAQAEAGNVYLLRGGWNDSLLMHLHGQPDLPHDDLMDACTGAFNALTNPADAAPEGGQNIWD